MRKMTTRRQRMFRKYVGAQLRRRRVECELTQHSLAEAAGIAQGSVSHYEQGRSEIPVSVFIALCRALSVRPCELLPELEVDADDPERAEHLDW